MPSTDGSVVIGVDMNVDDAEKQLASLKKKIQDIQSDIEFKKFRRDAMLERTKQLGAELDKAKAKLNEMETDTKGAFSKEAIKEQSDIVKGIQKEFDRVSGDVEKCDQAISDANISLDYMKQKYGEIAREAERLREAQSGAGAADSGGAQRLSGMENARARMSEVSKSFRQTLTDAAKRGVAAFGAALKRVPGLIKSAFSKGAQFIRSFGKSVLSAAKNLNVFSKLAESIGPKLSRIGKMIRRVFVFSVITMGLRALRSQLSSYLSVNAELQNALARLKGAFLTAFQPIYEYVVPALTSLINALTQAMAVVAQFVAALFGTTAKQAQENAKALNQQAKATEAAGGAAEDAGKALASFDKIEKLSVSSKGGGGGAAAENAPVFDLDLDDTMFKSWGEAFDAFLDSILKSGIPKLKKSLTGFSKWLNKNSKKILKMFTFPGVLDKVKKIGEEIGDAINGLVDEIEWHTLGESFGSGLNLAISFLTSAVNSGSWTNLGAALANWVNGAVSRIDWRNVGRLLWAGFKIGIETFAGFISGLDMPQLATAASNLIKGFVDSVSETIGRVDWARLGNQILTFFCNIDWDGISDSANNLISKFFKAAYDFVTELKVGEIAAKIVNFITDIDWGGIAKGASNLVTGFMDDVSRFFEETDWDELGKNVTDFIAGIDWKGIGASASNLIKNFSNALINFVENIDFEDFGHKVGDFLLEVDWFGIIENLFIAIGGVFEGLVMFAWGLIKSAWEHIVDLWADHMENGTILELAKGFVRGLEKWQTLLGPAVNLNLVGNVIEEVEKGFEINSPSRVMERIGGYVVEGLFNGMSNIGNKISTWGSAIIDGVKNFFGIHSPSTEFKKLGEYMLAGLGNGTEDESGVVVKVFESMFGEITALCAETVTVMTERFTEFTRHLTTEFSRQWNTTWQQLYNNAYQNIQKTISAINSLKSALASIERDITIRITTIKTEVSSGLSSGSSSPASAYALPAVTSIPIPALAQGTVIPPNREFMAVLGDNKTETEVVSPLSTIEQAVENAMRKVGFGGGQGAVFDISVYLDGETIYRNQQKIARQHGPSFAVTGG